MARKPKAATKPGSAQTNGAGAMAQPGSAPAGMFVLKKNHGLTLNGRASKFYAAGTTFDPATDGEVIAHLVRSGARIEEVPAEAEEVEESTEQSGANTPEGDGAPERGSQNEEQE